MFIKKSIFNYRISICLCVFILCHSIISQIELKNNLFEILFCFSKFAMTNFGAFLIIFLAMKNGSSLLKKQSFAIASWFLFFSYIFKSTNNIAIIMFYVCLNIENKIKKFIFLCISLFVLFHSFISNIYYKKTYGFPDEKNINVSLKPNIKILKNPTTEKIVINDYEIEIQKVASIELNAKTVFIEHYNKLFSYDYYEHPLYDIIAPLDLSVFVGEMADNWKKYKVKHEQRLLLIKPTGNKKIISDEWNNIHIIPSNTNIHKGFHTVKKGDDVYLKGYLIDWRGVGEFSNFKARTARYFGEASKELAEGNFTYLCAQFFVQELNVNGHTFK